MQDLNAVAAAAAAEHAIPDVPAGLNRALAPEWVFTEVPLERHAEILATTDAVQGAPREQLVEDASAVDGVQGFTEALAGQMPAAQHAITEALTVQTPPALSEQIGRWGGRRWRRWPC